MDLVKAKLVRPRIPEDIIVRSRLTDRIAASGHRAVVLHAPAGYGKTVLMTQFPLARSEIALWYRIDQTDNSFRQFLTYMASAMEPYFPGTVDAMSDLLTLPPDALSPEAAADRFLGILEATTVRISVFLDDVHLLDAPAANRFIRHVIHYSGKKYRMVLASEKPFHGLDDLPLDRRPLEVSLEDLRFSGEESARYLAGSGHETERDSLRGWPFGLSLLKNNGWNTLQEEREKLARQTAARLTPNEKNLLTVLASFPNASPALCDAVLTAAAGADTPVSAEVLPDLIKRGELWLTEANGTYSLHPAVEYVFRQQNPLSIEQREAALTILMKEGQYARAMGIALENQDGALAVQVLRASRFALLSQTEADRIRYFFSLLSDVLLEKHPALQLIAAAGALIRGEPAQTVRERLNTARAYFDANDDADGRLFAGLLSSTAYRNEKRYNEAAAEIKALFDDASIHPVAQADLIGEIAALAGPAPQAMRAYDAWREKWYETMGDRVKDPFALRSLSQLAIWFARDGQPDKAWNVHRTLSTRYGGYRIPAELLIQRTYTGHAREARILLAEILHREDGRHGAAHYAVRPDSGRYRLGFGLCLRAEGKTDEALQNFQQGRKLAENEGDRATAQTCRLEEIRTRGLAGDPSGSIRSILEYRGSSEQLEQEEADEVDTVRTSLYLMDGQVEEASSQAYRVLDRTGEKGFSQTHLEVALAGAAASVKKGNREAADALLNSIPNDTFPLSTFWLMEMKEYIPDLVHYLTIRGKGGGSAVVFSGEEDDKGGTDILDVYFFGEMRVEAGRKPVRWRTHRARDLFFYLALHRGLKVSRATLIDDLFPEATKAQLTHQVKNTLSLLRRGLDRVGFDNMIQTAAGEYWLDDERIRGDYFELVQLLHDIPEMNTAARREALREACALHSTEVCRGLDFPFLGRIRKNIRIQMENALLTEIQDAVNDKDLKRALFFSNELCRISPDNHVFQSVNQALNERVRATVS